MYAGAGPGAVCRGGSRSCVQGRVQELCAGVSPGAYSDGPWGGWGMSMSRAAGLGADLGRSRA